MRNYTILTMVLAAAFSRLIPHVPNVTAVTAMALLAGTYLTHRGLAVLIPLAALVLSDLVLGFHSTVVFVYGAVALIALLSSSLNLKASFSPARLAATAVGSSLLFFLITNMGVWLVDGLYEKSMQGLVSCYVMATPFLGTQIVGDLFYAALLFGVVEMIRRLQPALLNR